MDHQQKNKKVTYLAVIDQKPYNYATQYKYYAMSCSVLDSHIYRLRYHFSLLFSLSLLER